MAIGEIGLDYYYDTHPRELPQFWFRQQLRLAEELQKPVVIHSRDASQETFDIIKSSSVRQGVIHCYSGAWQMAMDYVDMGFYIGVGGVVTFSNAKKFSGSCGTCSFGKNSHRNRLPLILPPTLTVANAMTLAIWNIL